MKKRVIISFFMLFVCATLIILFNGNTKVISVGQVKSSLAEQTEDLVVDYKTTNSIAISWNNMIIPETVVKYNVYKDDQLITTVTNKSYIYASLTSGTVYNFKVDFLSQDDSIVMSKSLNNISPAKTISSFNQNMTLENDTYYITATTIPVDIVINVSAGSIIKLNSYCNLIINGTLNLNGTEEEKVIFTVAEDLGNDYGYHWNSIQVGSTGTFETNNAIIKNGGLYTNNYLYSNGITKLKNTEVNNVTTYGAVLNSGSVEIINSNIVNNIVFNNLTNIDIQNSTLSDVKIIYNNAVQENSTNILNNTITNGITYTPNILSVSVIQNNVIASDYSVLKIYLANANKDILKDVSGNTNSKTIIYGEIQILSMPTVADMIFPKSIYYIYGLTIPQGITMDIPAGSMIKLGDYTNLTINGTLNLQGTEEEKVIVTELHDTGYNCGYHWNSIQVGSTGTFETNNAIIKNGGLYTNNYLYSNGITKLKNTEVNNVTTYGAVLNSGSVEIINSNIVNNIVFNNLTNIDIQNSTLSDVKIIYNNAVQENSTNILNNTITNGITYTPNILSVSVIQNNVIASDYSVLKIYLANANKDILKDVSGNTNSKTIIYGEIQILSMPTVADMIFPKSIYYIYGLTIPQGITMNILAGSMIKLGDCTNLTINGTLNLQGTEEEKVIVTELHDTGYNCGYHWNSIQVGSTGTFETNNAIIKNGGKYTNNYLYSNGIIKLQNTQVSDVTTYGAVLNAGSAEIINSNIVNNIVFNNLENVSITNSNISNNLVFTNSNSINLQNSSFQGITVNYSNLALENDINILNNTITNGIIYTPNMLSQANIKDNISVSSYPIKLTCTNINPNIFKNISNNRNTSNVTYDGLYINGTINNLKLTNSNEYILGSITIPINKLLQIEAGTKCKIIRYSLITVNGGLVINGTIQDNVILTNLTDNTSYSYYKGIQINSTGFALINNMTMKYCGYSGSSSPAIQNNGKLQLTNSSITNIQSGKALVYNTSVTNQGLKYNYIGGSTTSNLVVDGTLNYWGAANGPRRYNPATGTYEGSGSSVDANILWNPYNTTFVRDASYLLDTYIYEEVKLERQHFGEDGINGYTGNYSKTYDDLNIVIPNIDLKFTRTYNSKNSSSDILGRGWTFGFSSKVEVNPMDSNVVYVYLPNGSINTFTKQSDGTYITNDARNILSIENGTYVLTTKEQTKYLFNTNKYLNQIIDKYGNITNITIDTTGKITNITDYTGRVYTIAYTNNKVSTITDPLNRIITYNYNAQGLLSEVIGLNGKSTYYEYDVNSYMTYIKEKNNLDQIITVESMTYIIDSVSGYRVLTVTNESGKIDTYSYNQTEKSSTITDQNSRVTKKYFDSKGYTTKIVEPNNLETLITYDTIDNVNKYGDVKSKTEITGQTTTYDRDSSGNIIKQTNSDGSYKTFEYNIKNSLTEEVDETGNITQYIYKEDNVTLFKKILPNNSEITFEYYPTGIKGLVSKKTDELGKDTLYEYDNYGNLTKTTNALQNYETYTYNTLGWLLNKTTCEGYTSTYEYDNVGNNTKITENSIDTINEYNYRNNLTKTIDANNNTITNEYDNAQNIVKKTDQENNITLYEYDIYKNITKETKPNGAIYTYEYDNLNRNTKTLITLDNVITTLQEKTYAYSSGSKTVTTKQYSNVTDYTTNVQVSNYLDKVISNTTEQATKTNTYLSNGLLSVETNEIGKRIYYRYNSLNKVSSKYEEIDNGNYKRTNYEYDAAGNVIKEETSNEKVLLDTAPTSYITTNYTYDDIGNITLK
ncbi:MAG: DUF6531 domain-containing protein, partial [Clostridia bacterium]|nr:DUF6531 domain-containing protein [Clostridia bacterium]